MHFAAFLDVGESVREPIRYYRNNVVGALACSRRWRRSRCSISCSRPRAPPTASRSRRRSPRRIRRSRSTATARRSWRSSTRCRTSRRAHGIHWVALRYFNAAGADPDGEIGEDHSPEIHLIPRAIEAATGGRGLQVFGDDYPTPDGTCLRDYVHVTDLADAHVRALEAIAETGKSGAYNLGTGRPHSVREVIDTVERVTGRTVPWTLAPRRAGDPAVLYAAPQKAQAELHWTPRYADLETIVRTAWDWHRTHPQGYDRSRRRDRRGMMAPSGRRCGACSPTRRRIAAGCSGRCSA